MARSRWRRLSPVLMLALVAAACAGGAQDPKDQLVEALRAMSAEPGVTITVSLDTDEASLRTVAEADGQSLSPELAGVLTTASLRVSAPFDPERTAMAVALRVGDADVAELRAVDDSLYVRADVPALLRLAGQDPASADGVRAMLTQSQVVPPEVVDGRWLALSGLSQMAEAMSGEPVGNPLDQVEARRAMERLATVLTQSSSVTRVGADEDGDHLRAAVPLREVYAAFAAEVEALGMGGAGAMPSPEEVPDESVTVDLWVRDGRLSAASLDLVRLAALDLEGPEIPEGTRLAAHVRLEPFDGVVEVPEDAAQLDVNGLMSLIMGGMGMAFGEGMAGMSAPSMPPGMPPGFDPSMMPPGFDPSMMPPGYDPSMMPPGPPPQG